MSRLAKTYAPPTHEEIAAAAQRIYETEGRPEGKAMEHWLRAEAQLVAERKAQANNPAVKSPAKPSALPNPVATSGMQSQAGSRPQLHRN